MQQKVPPHFKRCNGVTGRLQCAASEASGALLYTIAKIANPTLVEGMHQATRHQREALALCGNAGLGVVAPTKAVCTLYACFEVPRGQSAQCCLANNLRSQPTKYTGSTMEGASSLGYELDYLLD